MGVHGLSQITSILGPVRRLACFSGRTLPVRVHTAGAFKGKPIDVEIDDNSLMLLDFGGSRLAFLDATYCVEASLGPQLEIHGSAGTIAVTGPSILNATLQLYESERKDWRTIPVDPAPPIRDLGVLNLVETLRGEAELVLTGERGRHLVEIMAATSRAIAIGCAVTMETTF
jgi:predicted dehydrogenase